MLSYLSLLFFGTLHSDAYIFHFLLCFSLLFFSQLFVRPSQTAIWLFCISFPWGWSCPCLLSKVQWDITSSHLSEWSSSKSLQTINAEEGVEKRKHSCTVVGNVNWYSHCGRWYGNSLKTRNKTTIWPSNSTPKHIPWGNQNWKRHMYPIVHCSTIYNS